jgi:hypothetical protein
MNYTPLNFFGIIFCMMVGTASLPHILMRYFTTPSVKEARDSVAWSLLFIFLLYFSAPAYAAFSKLEVYTNIIGRDLTSVRPWMFSWGELGLIQICGKNAASIDAIVAACKAIAGHPGVVRLQDFVINTDVIVLSTPEIAGLPYVISGLVAAGGLAAALSTADGLLLAIANALSHDIYYKMLDPNAPTIRRLTVARVLLFFVAVASAALAATNRATFWPWWAGRSRWQWRVTSRRSCSGIWWKRTTTTAAILGMMAGWGICLFYLVTSRYFPQAGVTYFGMTSLLNPETGKALINVAQVMADPKWLADVPASAANPMANRVGWFDLNNINCGLLGMPLGFAGDDRGQPSGQGTVEGDAKSHRRNPQAPRKKRFCKRRTSHLPDENGRGPAGPRFFSRPAERFPLRILGHTPESSFSWTFQVRSSPTGISTCELHSGGGDVHPAGPRHPRPDRGSQFEELHLAVLLPDHRPGHRCGRGGDAESGGTRGAVVVRLRLAVWIRVGFYMLFVLAGWSPKV